MAATLLIFKSPPVYRPGDPRAVHFLAGAARRATMRIQVRQRVKLATAIGVGAFVVATTGCAKPLLSPREERTQYDRYDRIRNQYADQYVFDEFGQRRPNLRERLISRE